MITTKNQAIQFLTTIQNLHPMLHPEDDPGTFEYANGDRVFTDQQVKFLSDSFKQVYAILDDPCDIILNVIRPKMPLFNRSLQENIQYKNEDVGWKGDWDHVMAHGDPKLDLNDVEEVWISGYQFIDETLSLSLAYIESATIDGRELTDDELDYLNSDNNFIMEAIERDWLDENPRNHD